MKKFWLLGLPFVLAVASGCSSPCDALSDLCAKCKDSTTKNSCETTASVYKATPISGSNACQAVLDSKTYASCE
jgi:hypothetical protein